MIKMKKYIYLLTLAVLALVGCAPEALVDDSAKEYAGNRVKVTLEESIPAAGGFVEAIVKSEVPFSVSVPKTATWLTVESIEDTQVEVETQVDVDGVPTTQLVMEPRKVIKFTAGANPNDQLRYASIALIDVEKNIAMTRFDVCQDGQKIVKKAFSVAATEFNVPYSTTSVQFEVTGEVAWTVESSNENFIVSPASGEGDGTVTVTFPENQTLDPVTAEITVSTTDPGARPSYYVVSITQAANVKTFNVTAEKTEFKYSETTATISVESEVAWTVTSSNENFEVSPASGEGDGTITVTFPVNELQQDVTADIVVSTEDPLARPNSFTITLVQKSPVKAFAVTTEDNLSVAHDDFCVLFNVDSEVAWTATSSNEAFKFTDGDSTPAATVELEGNKNLFIVFSPNFTNVALSTTVTFTTEDPLAKTKTYSFDVTQAAYQVVSQTILAEWIFITEQKDNLDGHFNETTGSDSCHAEGNGGFYVMNNGQGNGRYEYYNSNHKADMQGKNKNRCKRVIGGSGEPCIYGTYVDDYMLYSATSQTELPAGTKVHLFTVWRPKEPQVMKYWKAEYLDGTEWKSASELKTAKVGDVEVKYNVELDFSADRKPAAQKNTYLDFVVELSVPTTEVKFRITSVVNAAASDGQPVATPYSGSYVLRVAGGDSASENNFFLNVPKSHVIEVVQ